MPLPAIITGLFGSKAKDIVTDVMGGLDNLFTSKEEKLAKQIELTEKVNGHILAMEQEVTKQVLSEDAAVTSRWQADMTSESKLSKMTRPLVMLSLLGFLFVIIIADSIEGIHFDVKPSYVSLLESLLITVVVAYFGSRGVEKFKAIHEAKNLK